MYSLNFALFFNCLRPYITACDATGNYAVNVVDLHAQRVVSRLQGRAVQVDPIKIGFCKRPWYQCLKLEYNEPLSHYAFSFNLRRYTTATPATSQQGAAGSTRLEALGLSS
jgi:hypothetical protein